MEKDPELILRKTPQVSQILGGTIWEPTCQYDFEVHLPHFVSTDGGSPRRTHIRPTPQISERLKGISNWEPTCQSRRRSSEVDLPHLVTPKKHVHLSCVAKLTPPIRLFFSCMQKIEVGSLFPSLFLSSYLFLFSLSPRFKIIEGDRWQTAGKQIPSQFRKVWVPNNQRIRFGNQRLVERCEFNYISLLHGECSTLVRKIEIDFENFQHWYYRFITFSGRCSGVRHLVRTIWTVGFWTTSARIMGGR